MEQQTKNDIWDEKQIPLKDVVLSNSWAMQAILLYLEEQNPGARDRIWQHYLAMKELADKALRDGARGENAEGEEK